MATRLPSDHRTSPQDIPDDLHRREPGGAHPTLARNLALDIDPVDSARGNFALRSRVDRAYRLRAFAMPITLLDAP